MSAPSAPVSLTVLRVQVLPAHSMAISSSLPSQPASYVALPLLLNVPIVQTVSTSAMLVPHALVHSSVQHVPATAIIKIQALVSSVKPMALTRPLVLQLTAAHTSLRPATDVLLQHKQYVPLA
jgi:hypothetical protein